MRFSVVWRYVPLPRRLRWRRQNPWAGSQDLVALFVVVTGVFGMAVGDALFLRLSIREGMAKRAGFGAASHGAGTARSYELGQQEASSPVW